MPQYVYKAMDKRGQVLTGSHKADNVDGLIEYLTDRGLFLIESQEPKAASAAEIALATAPGPIARQPKPADYVLPKKVALFTTELGIMVRTSLPIIEALDGLANQQTDLIFKAILFDISKSVQEGQTLSQAFSRYPKVFDDIYLSLLRAGESSGRLTQMLDCIVSYINFSIDLREKIRSALLYPVIVIMTSLAVVAFLVMFILPTFMDVFTQLGVELPLPTRILLGISSNTRRYWMFYVAGMFLCWWLFNQWLTNKHNIKVFDTFKLKLPIAGPVIRAISIVRMLRTLSALLSAGVPILRALELARDLAGNVVYRDLFNKVYQSASEGHGLSAPLRGNPFFPSSVVDMIANAEKTGTLPEVLDQVAAYYEKETDTTLKNLFAALEPLFVVFLGITVAGIAVSILLPIFQIGTAIQ